MGWYGMGCRGVGWGGVASNGLRWEGRYGVWWVGLGWDGLGCGGEEWLLDLKSLDDLHRNSTHATKGFLSQLVVVGNKSLAKRF